MCDLSEHKKKNDKQMLGKMKIVTFSTEHTYHSFNIMLYLSELLLNVWQVPGLNLGSEVPEDFHVFTHSLNINSGIGP